MVIWDRKLTVYSLWYIILLMGVFLLTYSTTMVHPVWVPIIIIIVGGYFVMLNICESRWADISDKLFVKRLFLFSLFFRIITGLVIYFIAMSTWSMPHYLGAADAFNYQNYSELAASFFQQFDFQKAYESAAFTGNIDDSGPALFTGFIYAITGSNFLFGMLFWSILGSISVVYLYKTARLIWDESIARTSGIMFMHFPLALFYSSVFMKEGFIVCFLIIITYVVTKSVTGSALTFTNIFVLIFTLVSIFFFRTAVGLGCVVLVVAAFLLNRYRGSYFISVVVGSFVIFVFLYAMYSMGEVEYFIEQMNTAEEVGYSRTQDLIASRDIKVLGVSLINLALAPIFVLLAVVTPFPGMVEVGTLHGYSHDHNYYNMAGSIIWNMLAYFSVIGFWYSLKEKFFSSMMITGFSTGYLYILIVTLTLTRDRFAFVGMPLLLILAAVGIYKSGRKQKYLWLVYLIALTVAIIVWNYLRLSIRGLI